MIYSDKTIFVMNKIQVRLRRNHKIEVSLIGEEAPQQLLSAAFGTTDPELHALARELQAEVGAKQNKSAFHITKQKTVNKEPLSIEGLLIAQLSEYCGPISDLIVKQAINTHGTPNNMDDYKAVVETITQEIADTTLAKQFQADAMRAKPKFKPKKNAEDASSAGPTAGEIMLTLKQSLVEYVGPIGNMLVEKTLEDADYPQDSDKLAAVIEELAHEISDPQAQNTFAAEMKQQLCGM